MVSKKKTKRRNENSAIEPEKENDGGGVAGYELSREQRIKANLERMQKLGILELSRNLKPTKPKIIRPQKQKPSPTAQRRSSRIQTLPTVDYSEKRVPDSKDKVIKDVKIEIKEGAQPEVYTEEHEKALGDYKETWTLCVDGYDDEGNRMYDQYEGKSCHQCRQKTTGHRTKCCKCKTVQGQFCGDCLFMRYGENVLEAKENPDWVCPACRDICNCSRCRRVKGWEPTGNLYRKVLRLGFKSVAHYLIQTRGPNGKPDDMDLNEEDDDDSKRVLSEKNIKHEDDGKKCKKEDDDSDYKSDHIDDDGEEEEDASSEEDDD